LFHGATFRGGLSKVRFTGQQRRIPPRAASGPHCSRPLRCQDGVNIYVTRRIEQPSSHRIKPRDTVLHCRIVPIRGVPNLATRTVRVELTSVSQHLVVERTLVELNTNRFQSISERVNTILTGDKPGSPEILIGSVFT